MGFSLSNNFATLLLRCPLFGALACVCSVTIVHSAPLGGQVVGGSGGITQSGLKTTIQQNSSALALDWQSFNVNNNEAVQFIQPDKNAIVLNRILGNSASQIFGRLDANGQVILVNPNGLFFGGSAVINVGGLLASGLDISPTDFLNGDYVFSALEGSEGAVINHGIIQAATGGSVSLLGRQVENVGFISAHLGAVNLVAAKEAVLSFDNDGLMGVKVNKAILQDELGVNPALLNAGNIQAEGGRVLLSASVSQDVFSQAVNNGGLQTASSVVMHKDGSFTLGAGANVVNSGSVDVSVSSSEMAGGQVVLLGENINHSGSIQADAINTQAGSVELQAKDTLLLTENSTASTRAELSGLGGDIKLLGTNVGLFDETSVDARGANGGGSVFIGGDKEGQNAQIPNSEFIFIGGKSNIYADALFDGNGGKVIAFAEDTARIYGNLFARGGEESGNGGFIETSGLKGFDILSSPDVSASFGEGGLWLIDPFDIDIVDGDNATQFINSDEQLITTPFIADGAAATLHVDLIVEALKNGDVTIKTTSSTLNEDHGNINFNADLNYSTIGSEGRTLTLESAKDIVFAQEKGIKDDVLSSADKLNVTLLPTGTITISSFAEIITRGGNFTVGNGSVTVSNFTNFGTIDTTGFQDQAGGNISINTTNDLTTGTLTSAGGVAKDEAGLTAGNINLSAGNDITISGAISAKGSDAEHSRNRGYDGGVGGSVTLSAGNTVAINSVIDVSGGKGDHSDDSPMRNGGNAGNIEINRGSILLATNLTAKGGEPSGDGATPGNGGSITFTGPVTLANHVELDASGNTNGDITFNNRINASGHQGQNLTLTGKEITFLENIAAAGKSLGDLDVTATGRVNAAGRDMFAKSLDINSGLAATTGAVNTQGTFLEDGGQVTINAQSVSVGGINTGGKNAGKIAITFTDSFVTTGEITALANGVGNNADISITGDHSNNSFTLGIGSDVKGKTVKLDGNGGKDIFNLSASISSSNKKNVLGGSGVDTFNITAASLSLDIDGESGNDTLVGADKNNQWDDIGDASGTLYQTATSTSKIVFSNVETIVGGSDKDAFLLTAAAIDHIDGAGGENSLKAADRINTWNITAKNAGGIENVVTFRNIQTLIGGNGVDTFNIEAAAISATLDGGDGNDTLVGANENNQWDIRGVSSGALYQTTTNTSQIIFSNIDTLKGGSDRDVFVLSAAAAISGINGGLGENSLKAADKENTWNITAKNSGDIENVVTFSNIQSLIGGDDVDTFNINAHITGSIKGGLGNDMFNLRASQSGLLSGESGDDTFIILASDLEADINGGADKDLLVAYNDNNQWNILGGESGELYQQNPVKVVSFSNIESLQGGGDKDSFILGINGSMAQINGGGGTNSLTGKNKASTWNINNINNGSVVAEADETSFSNIQNLNGGSEADEFRLGASGEVSSIDGGGGDNRLKAPDGVANIWQISDMNKGRVNSVVGFSNIQSIVGGTGIDEITFSQDGYIESLIDGDGGLDHLDLRALTKNVHVVLSDVISDNANPLYVLNVETIQANTNTNQTNTIVGANAANTWTISGENSGYVAPTNNPETDTTTSFSGFARILGGDLDDIFVMTSAGKITGEIIGGDQQSFDVVDYSQQSNVTVYLDSVSEVEKFRGNNQNITLVGSSNENTWEVTGPNSGTLTEGNNTISFEDFNLLKGGADTDTFNVTAGGSIGTLINGEMVGQIDGAGEDDTLNVTLTGSEQGQINFIGGGHNVGDRINISGGSESYNTTYSININNNAQLDYVNNGNNFQITYQSSEQISDLSQAKSLNIAGGVSKDEISLGENSFSVNNLAAVSYANKNELIVNGGGGSDSIDVAGAIDMPGKNVVLSAETLSNTSDGLINALSLYLEAVDTAGSDTARINTNIENLHIINSSNVYIDELNGINIAELDQADNIYISADSIADTAALVNDGTLSLNARSGDIVLDADNRLSGLLNLSAVGLIDIHNLTSTELGSVTANNLTLNSAGDIFGQGAVNVRQNTLFQSPGADIKLRGANDFSRLEIISANSASVNDVNTLLLENSQADVAINIDANGLQANNVSAGALVNLDAGSGHLAGSGLVAPRIELRATTGIGKEQAPVTTRTDTLFAENGTNQINIDNIGVVTLEHLKNTGDITFNNDADIYVKPGSVDAGFNTGTLVLKTETGGFLGLDEANPNNPDITAYAGIFFGLQGTFGTIKRPLVLNVQDSVLINSRSSLNPIFYPSQPRTVDDRSLLQFNAFDALSTLSGGQLVELETLAEINPAIFTDVRNYASAEIAIRLPRDQLYADELEEYEE